MAVMTFVGLLAPVYFIPPVFQAVVPGHRLISVMLSVASIVVLMTYVIMPALTRVGSFLPNLLDTTGISGADETSSTTPVPPTHRLRLE